MKKNKVFPEACSNCVHVRVKNSYEYLGCHFGREEIRVRECKELGIRLDPYVDSVNVKCGKFQAVRGGQK